MSAAAITRGRSLHQRLLVITATCALGIFAGLVALMVATSRMRTELTRVTNQVLEEQLIADRVIDGVMRQLVTISSATDQGFEALRPEFERASAAVNEGLRAYLFRDLTVEERLQIERVKEEHQQLEVSAIRAAEFGRTDDSSARAEMRRSAMSHALNLLAAMNGFLRLREIDLEAVAREQARLFTWLWLASAVTLVVLAMGIGVILTRFLQRRVVAPLDTVAEAARRLGAGEPGVQVPDGGDREFHDVATAFNRMSARLGDAQADLEARNRELEAALDQVRRTQDDLVQAEKLGALGRMSAGLAHELNNPLAAVLGYGELFAAELEERETLSREAARAHLDPILREARRARQLVRSLLQFSRRAGTEVGPVSLRDAMRVVDDLCRPGFERIGLTLRIDPLPDLAVRAEPQQLQGVFLNIANNALHAMEGRRHGTLHVHGEAGGDVVTILFEDDGPGLAEVERVFEPFYTTKEVGQGTGLGLALSRRFLESFGGEIRAENRREGGACFRVRLQVVAGPVPTVATVAATPRAATAAGRQTVLVVEDEAELRQLQARILERIGLAVQTAASVGEAIAILEAHVVDLVVSDVKMPGGSGLELLDWVRRERPALARAFCFVTGDVHAEELADFAARHPGGLIHKPFTIADYQGRLQALLAATASGR